VQYLKATANTSSMLTNALIAALAPAPAPLARPTRLNGQISKK
jgi:hypothetical protein